MDINIVELERIAQSVAHDTWKVQRPNTGSRGWEVANITGLEQICADITEGLAHYIAAASPATMLKLISEVRRLQGEIADAQAVPQPATTIPDGWQLVPKEPTPEMLTAATLSSHVINEHRAKQCYLTMLDAVSSPLTKGAEVENKIKPCPFCGGSAKRFRISGDERNGYAATVFYRCELCFVSRGATGDTSKSGYANNSNVEEEALASWNQRTI